MKVVRLETIPFALPVRREWRWRGLHGALGRWVLVTVHSDDDLVGLGEAAPLADWGGDFNRYGGETPSTVVHVIRDLLGPLLVGRSPFDVERIVAAMDAVTSGHLYAKAALEMALFDLQGKATGRPVYELLGGRTHDRVVVAHMIGIMSKEEAVDEARQAQADGCVAFQIKGTGEPDRDVALVGAIRSSLGEQASLRLDANQGYRNLSAKDAIRTIAALEDAGVDLIEQPGEGLDQMARFRSAAQVPIVADESCWQPSDVIDIVRRDAADALSIYVAKAGGLLRARKVATLGEAFGLPCDVNGSLESGVGNAANLHLATAAPSITLPAVVPVSAPAGRAPTVAAGHYYEDDVITEPFAYQNGALVPPDRPGLGVELDEEKLSKYRVDV